MNTLEGVQNGREYCFQHGYKAKDCPGCIDEMLKNLKTIENNSVKEKYITDAVIMIIEMIQKEPNNKCPECEIGNLVNSINDKGMFCSICDYRFTIDGIH